MAQRPQVPKFGDWEGDESVHYSTYFDDQRKGKKGVHKYENDSLEKLPVKPKGQKKSGAPFPEHEHHLIQGESEPRRSNASPLHPKVVGPNPPIGSSPKWHDRGPSRSHGSGSEALNALRPRHDRRPSREEGDMRRLTDSPTNWTNNSDSPHHHHGSLSAGDTPRRVARQSGGSDHSIERSPLHQHSHARVGVKSSGVSSPSWERKATSEGSHGHAPTTPGRSRLRSVTRGESMPDDSPAVPRFGEWDETDPAAAEGYTQIFNKVREEKHSETGKVPTVPTETSYSIDQKLYRNDDARGCWCLPWARR
ncbi:hypothetical protein CDL12_05337 [Handroanthus impetiginosus]|uniref:RIN4 pathogenic type III effector avirulence factor Avr cleavage site domain-containing protein n=1 Tax=Handroanthus impetiginosus TaxID=429701 RepID=A0A2G9HWR9_9LAMI|nr:hypothetical protein CDL12_05337 [Handroanthus impetiginosus]